MKNLKIIIKKGSILKSLIYNFKYLPFHQEINLPLIVFKNAEVRGKGKIEILNFEKNIKVYIGGETLNWLNVSKEYTNIYIEKDGIIQFGKGVFLGCGTKIEVDHNAKLVLDENNVFTGKTTIVCKNDISFGKNNLISWENLFMDSDGHSISYEGRKNFLGKIKIKDNVWIGCRCTIKKNTFISSNNVIASNTVLSGTYEKEKTIISGNPAKIVKQGVSWSYESPSK